MKRRIALKNMAAVVGGLTILPTWVSGWSKDSILPVESYLSSGQDELLAEIVETIIPATDTPGAKALNVHSFIQKMIADCYEAEVQQNMVKGLNTVNELATQSFKQPFQACNTNQRIEILTRIEKSDDTESAAFYKLIKELTIQGYMTSEYVMTHHANYQMVPGHYYGCVPVDTK